MERPRWKPPPETMEPWALREHVWVLRGLCAAGFALMGWGAYLEKSPIVFAGIAAVAVSCWFWRISGYTTLSAGPRGVDLSGDAAALREGPSTESVPAEPPASDAPPQAPA